MVALRGDPGVRAIEICVHGEENCLSTDGRVKLRDDRTFGFSEPKEMTTWHPRWNDFREKLAGPEGCDSEESGKSNCEHDFKFSSKILSEMGLDIEKSIAFFQENGGHCDCEILLNVLSEEDEGEFDDESEEDSMD